MRARNGSAGVNVYHIPDDQVTGPQTEGIAGAYEDMRGARSERRDTFYTGLSLHSTEAPGAEQVDYVNTATLRHQGGIKKPSYVNRPHY